MCDSEKLVIDTTDKQNGDKDGLNSIDSKCLNHLDRVGEIDIFNKNSKDVSPKRALIRKLIGNLLYYGVYAIISIWLYYVLQSLGTSGFEKYRLSNVKDISMYEVNKIINSTCTIDRVEVDIDQRSILFGLTPNTIAYCDNQEYRIRYDNAQTYQNIVEELQSLCGNEIGVSIITWTDPIISISSIFSSVVQIGITLFVLNIVLQQVMEAAKKVKSDFGGIEELTCRVYTRVDTKFDDIGGLSEAKEEIKKIVDMIRNRNEYIKMGADIPKGILLSGPPGCGKTLLAKAVAGEVGIPFISINAAEFDEKLVGVGPARIKKMFKVARDLAQQKGASIVFIDEIDAIGKSRTSINYKSTETLNMILTELDGFDSNSNVMVMAATNISDTLDPALTRSGRFDHKIYIDPPNKDDRIDLFKLYLRKLRIIDYESEKNGGEEDKDKEDGDKEDEDKKVECLEMEKMVNKSINKIEGNAGYIKIESLSKELASMTPGMTGADIKNVCNQAAVTATREKRKVVDLVDLSNAIDTIGIGLKKNSRKANEADLETVAYHESGHALIGLLLKDGESPVKMTIIPRGAGHLGYTMPKKSESGLYSRNQIICQMMGLLGGRIAEFHKFEKITTGASDDLKKVRQLAEQYFTSGLSDYYQNVYIDKDSKFMSDDDKYALERRINNLIHHLTIVVEEIVEVHSEELEVLAKALLEKETIDFSVLSERSEIKDDSGGFCNDCSVLGMEEFSNECSFSSTDSPINMCDNCEKIRYEKCLIDKIMSKKDTVVIEDTDSDDEYKWEN